MIPTVTLTAQNQVTTDPDGRSQKDNGEIPGGAHSRKLRNNQLRTSRQKSSTHRSQRPRRSLPPQKKKGGGGFSVSPWDSVCTPLRRELCVSDLSTKRTLCRHANSCRRKTTLGSEFVAPWKLPTVTLTHAVSSVNMFYTRIIHFPNLNLHSEPNEQKSANNSDYFLSGAVSVSHGYADESQSRAHV